MTTIQVVGVQHPAGRKHDHVRVFGYDVNDLRRRIIEVAVYVRDAVDLIGEAEASREFPEIEVDDRAWAQCLTTGDIQVVRVEHPKGEPGA